MSCGRVAVISERRVCRLCWEHACAHQVPGRPLDIAGANRFGQQLYFANVQNSRQAPRTRLRKAAGRAPRLSTIGVTQLFKPVASSQLALFEVAIDPAAVAARAADANSPLVRYCDEVVRDHAVAHGWSNKQTNDVRRTLRLAHVLQHTPDAKINASDVLRLPSRYENVSAASAIDVLEASGLLHDDRLSPVERYFNDNIVGLPDPMQEQLRVWFDVMTNGSTTTPRRHPRHPATVKLHTRALGPILRTWAAQGHDTLSGIEREHIVAVLPRNGPRRHTLEQGLRSLFRVLKGRKLVFVDPMQGIPHTDTNDTVPLPIDVKAVTAALASADPVTALAVALVAFHGLTVKELRELRTTDIHDGRIRLGTRDIPLARPVVPRLAAWLDQRNMTWPATLNPHLFINRRTAPRLTPVSRSFPLNQVSIATQALREDRIVDEVRATGGDVRRICELFGITVDTAMRYASTLDQTDTAEARAAPE